MIPVISVILGFLRYLGYRIAEPKRLDSINVSPDLMNQLADKE